MLSHGNQPGLLETKRGSQSGHVEAESHLSESVLRVGTILFFLRLAPACTLRHRGRPLVIEPVENRFYFFLDWRQRVP